jgi:hypothetical protein
MQNIQIDELADLNRSLLLGTDTTSAARGVGGFRNESSGGKYRSLDGTTLASNGRINSIQDDERDNPQKAYT